MLVKDLCIIQSNNYQKKDKWDHFNYLDTSNLTRNNLDSLQFFKYEKDLPSRAKQKVELNNILYSSVRPNQEHYGFVDKGYDNLLVSTGFIILKPLTNRVHPKFLFYFLTQKDIVRQLQTIAQNSTSSYPSISNDDLLNLKINLPSLKTQEKVVSILSLLDQQIERNNTVVKRLQVLSQYIFNRFFAQEKELISLLEFPYSQIIKPGINKFDKQKHYFATAEVDGEILNYKAPLIEYETRESRANMQPVENSVWFAKMKNSIKHIYVSQKDESLINNYIFSTGFCGIKCDDIAFEYLINYLNLPYFEKEKDILSHGATQEGIINEDLKSFKIHLPSKEKLCAFHNKTNGIHCRISEINHVTYQLSYIKEKLLPLLINGQLQ